MLRTVNILLCRFISIFLDFSFTNRRRWNITSYFVIMSKTVVQDEQWSRNIDGVMYYRIKFFAKLLDIKNVGGSIINLPHEMKKCLPFETRGGIQSTLCVTIEGLTLFLQRSRKPNVDEVVKQYGIDLSKTYMVPIEVKILQHIKAVFTTENIQHQYRVLCDNVVYYIDIYLPRWKIAIEVDETHHSKQSDQDRHRQNAIMMKEGCYFLRCSPYHKSFDIFNFLGTN